MSPNLSDSVSVFLALLSVSGLVACGGGPEDETVEASNDGAEEVVVDSLLAHSAALDRSLRFIESSVSYSDAVETAGGPASVCAEPEFRENRSGTSELHCLDSTDPVRTRTQDGVDEVIDALGVRFFRDRNVRSEKGDTITYRLDGSTTCKSSFTTACAKDVEASEIAIEITFTSEDDLTAKVQVGPNPYEPATLRISPNRLAVDLRLGDLRQSLLHIADATGTS